MAALRPGQLLLRCSTSCIPAVVVRLHHPADHLPSLPGHHLSTVSDADDGLDVGERAGGGLIVNGYVGKNAPQRKPRFDPSYF